MELLERERELLLLQERLQAVGKTGSAELVLIGGEAGVGKSALVGAFAAGLRDVMVLTGASEPLFTPRPLGPWLDIAAGVGGELERLVDGAPTAPEFLATLARALRRTSVLVLEDLHWADEASLDVLRLLGRRAAGLRALVVVTYRADEVGPDHPLRLVLGELRGPAVTRIGLEPLSPAAVAELVADRSIDAGDLYARTGGNPFYVTEVLAGGGETTASVRDAVLARAARLGEGARRLLGAVSIERPRIELGLLETLAGADFADVDDCVSSGMLVASGAHVAFRHEIARVTIEEALAPTRRMELHRAALAALDGRADPARLAHHAEGAGDDQLCLEHATAAGERAARLSAHREAAAQYRRALRHAGGLPAGDRAALAERSAWESYVTEDIEHAVEMCELAIAGYREAGDRLREGNAHRLRARVAWYAGDNTTAETAARRGVDMLEQLPPSRELALAYSTVAQLAMLDFRRTDTATWARKAIALAEELGETQILAHALNNLGTIELHAGNERGRVDLERSLALTLEAELEEDVARAYINLACVAVDARQFKRALAYLDAGQAYCTDRNLDTPDAYMEGWRARAELDLGQWDAAGQRADALMARTTLAPASQIMPCVVLGLLRARRGDPGAWEVLDTARELAVRIGELQRLGPVAAARLEAAWLEGDVERVRAEADEVVALAGERETPYVTGELLLWRHRAGLETVAVDGLSAQVAAELAGDLAAAVPAWEATGSRYDAAVCRAASEDEAQLRASHEALQALGARATAGVIARRMRELGVRVARGPRSRTKANPAGLTTRQLDVLAVLVEGASNAEIAERLFLSPKTVDHHVSAILRKLDVANRGQAAAAAARLGLLATET